MKHTSTNSTASTTPKNVDLNFIEAPGESDSDVEVAIGDDEVAPPAEEGNDMEPNEEEGD
jgi:hypothetical protein